VEYQVYVLSVEITILDTHVLLVGRYTYRILTMCAFDNVRITCLLEMTSCLADTKQGPQK